MDDRTITENEWKLILLLRKAAAYSIITISKNPDSDQIEYKVAVESKEFWERGT